MMLTALDTVEEKLKGFETGADEYLLFFWPATRSKSVNAPKTPRKPGNALSSG